MGNVEETLRQIQQCPELSELCLDEETLQESIQLAEKYLNISKAEKELEDFLGSMKGKNISESITYEQLTKCSFDSAKKFIQPMSLVKRISILKQLDHHLASNYGSLKNYHDNVFAQPMTTQQFYIVMGRIKHLEVLQAWLYGIN